MKKAICLLLAIVCVIPLASCGAREAVFQSGNMKITLTSAFKEKPYESGVISFVSDDVSVLAEKESFEDLGDVANYTVAEYRDFRLTAATDAITVIKINETGLVGFEFIFINEEGKSYRSLAACYKSEDAFWMIQFVTRQEDFADYRVSIRNWAKSVIFEYSI